MTTRRAFPPDMHERLGYYVYLLADDNDRPFYVGKGSGNRIFEHLRAADDLALSAERLDVIRRLGDRVRCLVLRHGLTEKEAFEVESAFIDFLGIDELTNQVHGAHAHMRGLMSVDDLVALYEAPAAEISEPVVLINIRQRWRRGMTSDELYNATRNAWVVAPERHAASYAFSVSGGVVRQVYSIARWYRPDDAPNRWAFDGSVATDMSHYIGCSVASYSSLGAQNPIRYVNC